MRPHAWQVLARIGDEASIAHLRARFAQEKGDLLSLESLSDAALAQAAPGLVELLEAERHRDIPCVNEAWVTLCALHGLDRPGLAATRARIEQRYGEAVQSTEALLGIGGEETFGAGPMNLALECGACGSQNHYRISALWLDPDKPGDAPHIGDDIRCPCCGGAVGGLLSELETVPADKRPSAQTGIRRTSRDARIWEPRPIKAPFATRRPHAARALVPPRRSRPSRPAKLRPSGSARLLEAGRRS